MRKAVIVSAAILAFAGPAQATKWCAKYNATNCGFTSYQQCMATVRGAGRTCVPKAEPTQHHRG